MEDGRSKVPTAAERLVVASLYEASGRAEVFSQLRPRRSQNHRSNARVFARASSSPGALFNDNLRKATEKPKSFDVLKAAGGLKPVFNALEKAINP